MSFLSVALVVLFLLLVGWLSDETHEDAEKVLAACKADVTKAHAALAANPPDVKRALSFLSRWA